MLFRSRVVTNDQEKWATSGLIYGVHYVTLSESDVGSILYGPPEAYWADTYCKYQYTIDRDGGRFRVGYSFPGAVGPQANRHEFLEVLEPNGEMVGRNPPPGKENYAYMAIAKENRGRQADVGQYDLRTEPRRATRITRTVWLPTDEQ